MIQQNLTLVKGKQGGHKVGEKIFPQFFRIFHSHNYIFPEVIATQILAIWQHLGRLLAIFSLGKRRNSYFT